jgi:retinol dehydrogenase-12
MNAGLASGQWNTSPEGWEMQLQVNVLSTSLWSLLLPPMLMRTRKTFPESKPRLVILGSDIHMQAKFEERKEENILKALNDKKIAGKSPLRNLRRGIQCRNCLTFISRLN